MTRWSHPGGKINDYAHRAYYEEGPLKGPDHSKFSITPEIFPRSLKVVDIFGNDTNKLLEIEL